LSVDVIRRNGLGSMGGRVLELQVRGTGGRATLTGAELRLLYSYSSVERPAGIRSDWFRVTNNPSGGLSGYWVAAPDGGIFTFGDAGFFGSTGNVKLNRPVVAMAPTTTGEGYWLVASDGGVFTFGDAGFFGSTGDVKLAQPVIGVAPTPAGAGYWMVARDGGIFTFGDAGFFGSLPALKVPGPAAAMRATRTGGGYMIVTANGTVASFGDAPVLGGIPDLVPGYAGGVVAFDVKPTPPGA
ncbi:MAG: hypothetical protein ACRDZ7_21870, partial [Acidimicrobiia bacterium]